jgi:hypothetical protein
MISQKNEKDCLQTTLANLLSIPYEVVPTFYQSYEKRGESDFFIELDDWLNSIGRYRILFDAGFREDGKISIPFYCGVEKFRCIGILEKEGRKFSHAVLLEFERKKDGSFNIEMYDPKPNSEYDLFDLVQIEIIAKREESPSVAKSAPKETEEAQKHLTTGQVSQ